MKRAMHRSLLRFLAGVVCGLIVSVGVTSLNDPTVTADHPRDPLSLAIPPHTSSSALNYTQCGVEDDEAMQAMWAWGPETWEDEYRGSLNVTLNGECEALQPLTQGWEADLVGFDCNLPGAPACRIFWSTSSHGTHVDVTRQYLAFNAYHYPGLPSDGWRNHVSAHEFGHVMSLGHHSDGAKCSGTDWVMTVWPAEERTGSICQQIPNEAEVCSSHIAYGFRTQSCALDADSDGCTDWEEEGDDELLGGNRSDGTKWDFFEVTDDRLVDINDAVDVLSYFGDAGTSAAGNHRDRAQIGTTWETVEANDGISLDDAIAVMAQFGHDCTKVP